MDIEISGDDRWGCEAYGKLFNEIMSDLDKAVLIDRAKLVLSPEKPLFLFTVVLKAAPGPKTVGDVSTVRADAGGTHVTVTDERYAPDLLSALFRAYGRSAVKQQTRFDLIVAGAPEDEIAGMKISTGEETAREIMGAIWRAMPEGIKNRRTLMSGNTITVIATEETLEPEMIAEGRREHIAMGGSPDV